MAPKRDDEAAKLAWEKKVAAAKKARQKTRNAKAKAKVTCLGSVSWPIRTPPILNKPTLTTLRGASRSNAALCHAQGEDGQNGEEAESTPPDKEWKSKIKAIKLAKASRKREVAKYEEKQGRTTPPPPPSDGGSPSSVGGSPNMSDFARLKKKGAAWVWGIRISWTVWTGSQQRPVLKHASTHSRVQTRARVRSPTSHLPPPTSHLPPQPNPPAR